MQPELQPSRAEIADWVTKEIANYVRVPAAEIHPDVPVAEYGLDSVFALALCGEIEDKFLITVDPTLVWDYPTVDLVAEFIHSEIGCEAR